LESFTAAASAAAFLAAFRLERLSALSLTRWSSRRSALACRLVLRELRVRGGGVRRRRSLLLPPLSRRGRRHGRHYRGGGGGRFPYRVSVAPVLGVGAHALGVARRP
jgi:hypothetical protein